MPKRDLSPARLGQVTHGAGEIPITKQAGKGTGLGLSICYGIVRAHGGEILCWNNSEDSGSTFVVRVPIANEASVTAALAKEAGR